MIFSRESRGLPRGPCLVPLLPRSVSGQSNRKCEVPVDSAKLEAPTPFLLMVLGGRIVGCEQAGSNVV